MNNHQPLHSSSTSTPLLQDLGSHITTAILRDPLPLDARLSMATLACTASDSSLACLRPLRSHRCCPCSWQSAAACEGRIPTSGSSCRRRSSTPLALPGAQAEGSHAARRHDGAARRIQVLVARRPAVPVVGLGAPPRLGCGRGSQPGARRPQNPAACSLQMMRPGLRTSGCLAPRASEVQAPSEVVQAQVQVQVQVPASPAPSQDRKLRARGP